MDIKELKNIPINEYLAGVGRYPAKVSGHNLWYLSPLRHEETPSFKVNCDRNLWYDFGLSQGGDLVKFALLYWEKSSIPDLLEFEASRGTIWKHTGPGFVYSNRDKDSSQFSDFSISSLARAELLAYCKLRGISSAIASRFCSEAHYKVRERSYFSIAFPNLSEGYELRNQFFKGCFPPKAYSLIRTDDSMPGDSCYVFEGFFDFLTFQEMLTFGFFPSPDWGAKRDCVILNSVANLVKCKKLISRYPQAYLFLDMDPAGRAASDELSQLFMKSDKNCLDVSKNLFGKTDKDLNAYWLSVLNVTPDFKESVSNR